MLPGRGRPLSSPAPLTRPAEEPARPVAAIFGEHRASSS